MNAKEKTFWHCSKCGARHQTQEAGDQCCGPKVCSECGKSETYSPYTVCKDCKYTLERKRDRERFEKAEKILEAQWDGPVYSDDFDENDGFAESVSEIMEHIIDDLHGVSREENRENLTERNDTETEFEWACRFVPEYMWACDIIKPHVDARDIIERVCECLYEDAYDSIVGHDDLQKVLDEWCAQQTVVGWEPNYKKAILVDRAYWVEELRKNSVS